MIFEGVNFIERVCKSMSKDEFISKHIDAFWQDRAKKERKRMLSDAYDVMNPPSDTKE